MHVSLSLALSLFRCICVCVLYMENFKSHYQIYCHINGRNNLKFLHWIIEALKITTANYISWLMAKWKTEATFYFTQNMKFTKLSLFLPLSPSFYLYQSSLCLFHTFLSSVLRMMSLIFIVDINVQHFDKQTLTS